MARDLIRHNVTLLAAYALTFPCWNSELQPVQDKT